MLTDSAKKVWRAKREPWPRLCPSLSENRRAGDRGVLRPDVWHFQELRVGLHPILPVQRLRQPAVESLQQTVGSADGPAAASSALTQPSGLFIPSPPCWERRCPGAPLRTGRGRVRVARQASRMPNPPRPHCNKHLNTQSKPPTLLHSLCTVGRRLAWPCALFKAPDEVVSFRKCWAFGVAAFSAHILYHATLSFPAAVGAARTQPTRSSPARKRSSYDLMASLEVPPATSEPLTSRRVGGETRKPSTARRSRLQGLGRSADVVKVSDARQQTQG